MNTLNQTFCSAACAVARRAAAALAAGLVAVCTLWLAPLPALAQDLKIGYVNFDRLMSESLPARSVGDKLAAEFGKRDKELDEQATRVQAAAKELDKDSPTLTEYERARRQRELVDRDRELMRKRREFNEEVAQRRNEEMAILEEQAHRAIRQIFKQEKYDLILRDAVLVGPKVDITDQVIKALGTMAPAAR